MKLRLEELAQSSSPRSLSGFIARHIEHPAARHSKPASISTRSMPSRSQASLTRVEPGTAMARTPGATLRPRSTAATSRKSLRRAFVQEPRNATFTGVPAMAWPPCSCMCASASATDARSLAGTSSGCGTRSSMKTAWPGLMPQVTVGAMSAASMTTTSS